MFYFLLKKNIILLLKIIIFYICYFNINISKSEENTVLRYASIKADESNLRVGPGQRYPIDWVLRRKNLPVAIIDEMDNFRKIELYDGTIGWLHRSLLSNKKTGIILSETHIKDLKGKNKAKLLKGVIVNIKKCRLLENKHWCKVEVNSVSGLVSKNKIWGTK